MAKESILSWTPAAVVFDCDGTLMDSEQHWQEARELVLRGYGVAPDRTFAARAKGLHYAQCGQLMAETAGRAGLAVEMTRQLLDAFRKLVAENPVTCPGAHELVLAAAEFAPLAVASNCPRDVVESSLDQAGLLSCFAHVVVPEDGLPPKPDPAVYLRAVELCGAAAADSLAVEDSACGIRSAVGAGLRVLGVGPRPSEQEITMADLWVGTLAEPTVLDWAASWKANCPVA
ncbi:HAD family phosphatase [Streptacidiphilus sp. P02-A3a]|jgi:HAD superfamily hydrolase (TIGR01509 family)|uniref:HAD family hydrolase n=1 Tax=Streptacidiphilus sp. P02-A3a TaxID=2704468 RepID=UPI0015F7948B|nr:HAD family phosphatase [Streptacidiphilus sp. P02-A3a]QMU70064.1 HAD family phosphatase [Streptacidiphilus sp. P02-A3a]